MASLSSLFCRVMDSSRLLPMKQERTLSPKGKEKVGEEVIGDGTVCGICFSGGGLAVRGRIDSCDHYFCFICIMEWARVESRCPICKRRFHFIRRPEVSGLFISESVLKIPVRDQVYHPLGNESMARSDPYAQVNCRVCCGSNDDELLLLCDLCDSAVHTYCTGLGCTVPAGDWYCHDCTILREEHAKIDEDARDMDQDQATLVLDQQQPVSVFDIVADERSSTVEQQHFHDRPAPRSSTNLRRNSEGIMLRVEELDSSQRNPNVQRQGIGQREWTSQHSCKMQSRVQALRKNWTALQSGSLAFSSTLDGNGDPLSGGRLRTSRPDSDQAQHQSNSSASGNSEQPTGSSSSRIMPANNDSQDINKAWKMMQMAKKQRFLRTTNSFCKSFKFNGSLDALIPVSTSKGAAIRPSKFPKNKTAADKAGCSASGTYEKRTTEGTHDRRNSTGFYRRISDVDSSNQSQHGDRLAGNAACSSLSIAPSEPARKSFVRCSTELPQDGNEAATSSSEAKGILNRRGKAVIQSLVKQNLSQLSKGKCLGVEKFKDIARVSTHSILAACGLEHSESHARPFPSQVCGHAGSEGPPLRGSMLMPGSCRGCFDSFVNNVVKSILLEKSNSSAK